MVKNSLGLIEVVGLAAALEAADAALKSANIELIGYEFTKGGGLVLVKICGDVGAVKAGVEAGRTAASKVNKVWSTHVIPRPHQQLSCILETEETRVVKNESKSVVESQVVEAENEVIESTGEQSEVSTDAEIEEEAYVENQVEEEEDNSAQEVIETPGSEVNDEISEGNGAVVIDPAEKEPADYCNLCNDPTCHRKKGDPKVTCIYYGRNN